MLLIKLLLLITSGGTIAGVTYSQVQKTPSTKTAIVSNNQESKIRAKLEKQMDVDILKHKQTLLNARKDENTKDLSNKKNDFETAEQSLKNAYQELNDAKTTLNNISKQLTQEYSSLQTKNDAFLNALKTQMQHQLNEESKKLKKAFYEEQQTTYNKEKDAIVAKINAIYTPTPVTRANSVCNGDNVNWTPTPAASTTEEINIKNSITGELTTICVALNQVEKDITANEATTSNPTQQLAFNTAKTNRETSIRNIDQFQGQYNLQIIEIKSKENNANMQLLNWQNKKSSYDDAKKRYQETENELELIATQIQNN